MGEKGTEPRYVLLDLGDYFAAGRVIRNTPHMVTLEVVRDRERIQPAYSREKIHQMIPIDKRTAKVLLTVFISAEFVYLGFILVATVWKMTSLYTGDGKMDASHAVWASVLRHVRLSIQAEQVFCSIVTEMKFLPQFSYQDALKTVHKENYETSYHRNTAAGNLRRLIKTRTVDEMLILMTVECFIETLEHDRKAETALREITVADPVDEKWLIAAQKWHMRRKQQLKHAAETLYAAIRTGIVEKGGCTSGITGMAVLPGIQIAEEPTSGMGSSRTLMTSLIAF